MPSYIFVLIPVDSISNPFQNTLPERAIQNYLAHWQDPKLSEFSNVFGKLTFTQNH